MEKINWRKWSSEAFAESEQTDKPVLLAIGAVWCHWCHVMDNTTYSNPRVIDLINENYIPIRVDNDREPDINERYNMGGWPTTAILTPGGDVITGGTYMPPSQMADLLDRVSAAYAVNKDDIVRQAAEARSHEEAGAPQGAGEASMEDVERVMAAVRSYYDQTHGGFGWGQKFPMISVLEFLILNYERTGMPEYLDELTGSLDAMLAGEVFDPVEGGMFRYATQRDWRVPHYEKMLGDNAGIAQVLLDAFRLTGNEAYLKAARGVFTYLDNTLLDPYKGVYFGSQDADEEYYTADVENRRHLTPPHVDTAAYTDTNAKTALAWLRLWSVANDAQAREKAVRILDFFNSLDWAPDGTVAHYFEDDQSHSPGQLADQVYLAFANIVAFEATAESAYLDAAIRLLDPIDEAFKANVGAYYDISAARAQERGLTRRDLPLGENCTLATLCLKMAALTGDSEYQKRASDILAALSIRFENYGILAADYATAVTVANSRPVVVSIARAKNDEHADALTRTSLATCGLRCVVKPEAEAAGEEASASICVGTTCRTRTSSPDELAEGLREAMAWI